MLREPCAVTEQISKVSLPTLDEIVREAALRMIAHALEAEVADYLACTAHERDVDGRALVVRNGYAESRKITIGSGTLEVEAPRVNDKRIINGERQRFRSGILPPYMRRSAEVSEVLPVLYLRGLSSGDFAPALRALLGTKASGLSPSSISRMLDAWQAEYDNFRTAPIDEKIAYVWVDGIHSRIRLEEDGLCLLVVIGVNTSGKKRLLAVADGYRESEASWAEVLRELISRGMDAPAVAVGDGALGFWAAMRNVWPKTKAQRCIFHKMGNILDKLPKKVHPVAKQALRHTFFAETKAKASRAADGFRREFGRYTKAVACFDDGFEQLLTFMDFPKEHWKSLRTTNIIESSFATVRLRTASTKGAGCRRRGITMAYKLLAQAEQRWRSFDGAAQLSKVLIDRTPGQYAAA
jgi:putative transposase